MGSSEEVLWGVKERVGQHVGKVNLVVRENSASMYLFVVLGIEPKASCLPGKLTTPEPSNPRKLNFRSQSVRGLQEPK
jgi:hypothetical protein